MNTEALNEHRWLQRLAGEWIATGEALMSPDQPLEKWEIPECVSGVGELWVQCVSQGEMPGCGPVTMVMTLGYDPARKHFVGTFIGSMMTHLWIYEGDLDAGGQELTLRAEGPVQTPDADDGLGGHAGVPRPPKPLRHDSRTRSRSRTTV